MRRELLVGTFSTAMEFTGSEFSGPWLFTKFFGEGAEGIVFEVTPLDGAAADAQALKLVKGLPMFEMQTLHHSLRVHEELYPDHPLRMSAQARLELLTREMLTMIDNNHLMLRVRFYQELLTEIITALVRMAAERKERREPVAPLLEESPFCYWADDNLIQQLEDDLDEELIVEEYRPLIEELLPDIESAFARRQEDESYVPLSRNPFFNLLGLYLENFISEFELQHIGDSDEFGERLKLEHVLSIHRLAKLLYFRITNGRADGSRPPGSAEDRKTIKFAVTACRLVAQVCGGRLLGMTRLWEARILILDNEAQSGAVESVLRSALGDLQEEAAAPQRSEALLLLADLFRDRDPDMAAEYRNQANQIKER